MATTPGGSKRRGGSLLLPVACVAARSAVFATRVSRRGSGSAFPGLLAEKIRPDILRDLGRSLDDGCVLITGTNGKTTTAGMLRRILEDAGWRLASNPSGSNLSRGVIAALLRSSDLFGRADAPFAVLEVDEAALPRVARSLPTRGIVVLNLFRDQLDRYGEIDSLARVIGSALPEAGDVYLNADDPLVSSLAAHLKATAAVRYFGLAGDGGPLPQQHASVVSPPAAGPAPSAPARLTDSDRCPVCHASLIYDRVSLSHLGSYRCPRGDFTRPHPDVEATVLPAHGAAQQILELRRNGDSARLGLPLPGVHNAYDAVAAAAVATYLGVPLQSVAQTLAGVSPAFGRGESFSLSGREIFLLLVKNPASFNQVLDTLRTGYDAPWLMLVNDNLADGTDVSWLWDVAFEQLAGTGVNITSGGSRGLDLAVRLKYAGVDSQVQPTLEGGLDHLLTVVPEGARGYIVATYTAMLEIRKVIGRRTRIKDFSEWTHR